MNLLRFFGFGKKPNKNTEEPILYRTEGTKTEHPEEVLEEETPTPDKLDLILQKLIDLAPDLAIKIDITTLEKEALPDIQQRLLDYAIFGSGIYSIPCRAVKLCSDNDDEFSVPFRFFNLTNLENFKTNYAGFVPDNFLLIGYLNDTDVVVMDEEDERIYIFHVSDVADLPHLEYKLGRKITDLYNFLKKLSLQTVCCFVKPDSGLYFDRFEIKNKYQLLSEIDPLTVEGKWGNEFYDSEEEAKAAYDKLVAESVAKGYQLLYGPLELEEKYAKK